MIYDLGGIDADAQTFLGSLLMLGYEQAALSRKRDLGAPRRQHQLLIDEAMRFADKSQKSMTTMLSETRKYGLFMTMAHQTFIPEDEHLRRSLGNALRIAFRVNREDALWLAPQFAHFDPHVREARRRGLNTRRNAPIRSSVPSRSSTSRWRWSSRTAWGWGRPTSRRGGTCNDQDRAAPGQGGWICNAIKDRYAQGADDAGE